MKEHTYVIGLDFGSLSCRGILADAADGNVLCEKEYVYPHGVMEKALPGGVPLPPDWALQHPDDFEDGLIQVLRSLVREGGVPASEIAAVGIDTTASTVLAVDAHLNPLCRSKAYAALPHAWPKMWKHHAAAPDAKKLTEACYLYRPDLPEVYGGSIGPEFLLPKVMQVCREAPEVFAAADTFLELGDWLASLLTGREIRSGSYLTCKALYTRQNGYPAREFFSGIDPALRALPDKLALRKGSQCVIAWPGEPAGHICPEIAEKTGLHCNTVITPAQMDGYAGIPGCGIAEDGTLMIMLGTSSAFMLMDRDAKKVPGICAAVRDSILPGYVNYAAGQSSTGDLFSWFLRTAVPDAYREAAASKGTDLHGYLSSLAEAKGPGGSGLIALDWWNGNKSVLNDAGLSGLLVGMNLSTTAEDIYLALMESVAFGARKIIDNFEAHGVAVRRIVAGGGIARKNPVLMQIYANVTGREIAVSSCTQAAAQGSAIYASASAGCHPSVAEAVKAMAPGSAVCYYPEKAAHEIYDQLYREYLRLHDYFGVQCGDIMKNLKRIAAK